MNWLGWIVIRCEAGCWVVPPPPSPPPPPPSPPPVHQTHRGPSHCSQPASHYNLSLANSVQIENCTAPNFPFVSYWSLTHSRALWHIVGKRMAWFQNTLQPSGTLHTIGYLSVPKEKVSNESEKFCCYVAKGSLVSFSFNLHSFLLSLSCDAWQYIIMITNCPQTFSRAVQWSLRLPWWSSLWVRAGD